MDIPLVTIGVSTYNREVLLRESLQSLLAQTLSDYEIIVVDDGSSDGTGEMVRKEFPMVRYFYQENRGDAAAKNRAAGEARGTYLVFNDSDDRFFPDTLERLYRPLQNHPGACSYGQYTHLDIDGNEQPAKLKMGNFPSGNILEALLSHIIVHCCGFMMPTSAFLAAGGFDETLRVGHDYKFGLEMARQHCFFSVSQPVFQRRRHSGNLSRASYQKVLLLRDIVVEFCRRHPEVEQQYAATVRKRLARMEQNLAREAAREKMSPAVIRGHLCNALRHQIEVKTLWRYLFGSM